MKELYLIRHAKSSWRDTSIDDFIRPLNKRGETNAPFMAKLLLNLGILPDFILSSSALRAKTTAEIFAHTLEYQKEISFKDTLYLTSTNSLLNHIHSISNEHNIVFIFGHNPELTQFANDIGDEYIENIPTCGIAGFELNIKSWKELGRQISILDLFEFPKKYS